MITIATDPSLHRAFDLAAWACGLGLGWLLYRLKLVDRTAWSYGSGYMIAAGLGAIIGAWWAGALPAVMAGHGAIGHSVAGALAGGVIAIEAWKLSQGVTVSTGGPFVAPFALGIVIGRLGCLFAGVADGTFGVATLLPWGVDLGDGVARHPVQLYESGAMLAFLVAYVAGLARRHDWATRHGFHVMVAFYGAQRFVWEFFKPYPKLAGPFNAFHAICGGLVIYGLVYIYRNRQRA